MNRSSCERSQISFKDGLPKLTSHKLCSLAGSCWLERDLVEASAVILVHSQEADVSRRIQHLQREVTIKPMPTQLGPETSENAVVLVLKLQSQDSLLLAKLASRSKVLCWSVFLRNVIPCRCLGRQMS